MGRTKRKRHRKDKCAPYSCLDNTTTVINLRKCMSHNGWINDTNLKIYDFPETGRGVSSTKSFKSHDTLITIPYNLMITLTTIQLLGIDKLLIAGAQLTIHEFLSLFLIVEKQKNHHSKWRYYIESLPSETPPLPWFLTTEQINLLPVELGLNIMKTRRLFEESWNRIQQSITEGNVACLVDMDLFLWAYSMVNTRAVYVDPCIVRKLCTVETIDSVLSDEPCMALCPYLDMFNHSHETCTNAEFVYKNHEWSYQLVTLTNNRKYQQIFISYGNHDNVKLLVEYGFFINDNRYDSINFTKDEIINELNLNLTNYQYKFIIQHKLDDCCLLYLNKCGISFNLKAFLFVCLNRDERQLAAIIYGDLYPEDFHEIVVNHCKRLLECKRISIEYNLRILESQTNSFQCLNVVCQFLSYRRSFIESLYGVL